ncbi:MAG: hypothetical protein ACXVEE_12055 [Polyangiales bacterium]
MRRLWFVVALACACRGREKHEPPTISAAPDDASTPAARPRDAILELRTGDVARWTEVFANEKNFADLVAAKPLGPAVAIVTKENDDLAFAIAFAVEKGPILVVGEGAAKSAAYLTQRVRGKLPGDVLEIEAVVPPDPTALGVSMEHAATLPRKQDLASSARNDLARALLSLGHGVTTITRDSKQIRVMHTEPSAAIGLSSSDAIARLAALHGGGWAHDLDLSEGAATRIGELVAKAPEADAIAKLGTTAFGALPAGCGFVLHDVHLSVSDVTTAEPAVRALVRRVPGAKATRWSGSGWTGERIVGTRTSMSILDDAPHFVWGARGKELFIARADAVGVGDADCPVIEPTFALVAPPEKLESPPCPAENVVFLSAASCAVTNGAMLRWEASLR